MNENDFLNWFDSLKAKKQVKVFRKIVQIFRNDQPNDKEIYKFMTMRDEMKNLMINGAVALLSTLILISVNYFGGLITIFFFLFAWILIGILGVQFIWRNG